LALSPSVALGYRGNDNSVSVTVRRYEAPGRKIPPHIARLARMYEAHCVPFDFLKHARTKEKSA
jgi:hypothetical protein